MTKTSSGIEYIVREFVHTGEEYSDTLYHADGRKATITIPSGTRTVAFEFTRNGKWIGHANMYCFDERNARVCTPQQHDPALLNKFMKVYIPSAVHEIAYDSAGRRQGTAKNVQAFQDSARVQN